VRRRASAASAGAPTKSPMICARLSWFADWKGGRIARNLQMMRSGKVWRALGETNLDVR
jgi:hypothetical protein